MADTAEQPNSAWIRFDRLEVAGSLGDLGTLLPLALGMILLCGMDATSVLVLVGAFYVVSGLYFRTPTAVQPMKAIGAYAITAGLTQQQIAASGLWMAALLLLLGGTNLITHIRRLVPLPTIRGVQLGLGAVLMVKGLEMMADVDGGLVVHQVGPVPVGLLLGGGALVVTFALLGNRRVPAALVVLALGVVAGLLLGQPIEPGSVRPGLYLPEPLPYGFPSWRDFAWVLPFVVLPQLPMTVGNAIYSNTDLAHEYFPERASRMTNRASSISQGLANAVSFLFGGIPMCHGAGGLAAHYRFGARTAGSNLFIGALFVVLALVLGDGIVPLLSLIPLSVLGVLLVFAGLQLALMIKDVEGRGDLFVVLLMMGLTLAFNLAVAFFAGIAVAWIVRRGWIRV
jgi:SulP family sulfate permease